MYDGAVSTLDQTGGCLRRNTPRTYADMYCLLCIYAAKKPEPSAAPTPRPFPPPSLPPTPPPSP